MRLIRFMLHILLLLIVVLGLLAPLFYDYQDARAHPYSQRSDISTLYLLLSPCMGLGAAGGAFSCIVAFFLPRGKAWAQGPWTWQKIAGGLIRLGYWFITGACVGGAVGLLGILVIVVLIIAGTAFLLFPLLLLIPEVLLIVPVVALAVMLPLVFLLDYPWRELWRRPPVIHLPA